MTAEKRFFLPSPQLTEGTWAVTFKDNLLHVRFVGNLKAAQGVASSSRAVALAGSKSFHLIGDLLDLERYDSEARVAWQNALLPIRGQIESIHIGTSNRIVRMGVTVFGLFLGRTIAHYQTRLGLETAAARCANDFHRS